MKLMLKRLNYVERVFYLFKVRLNHLSKAKSPRKTSIAMLPYLARSLRV